MSFSHEHCTFLDKDVDRRHVAENVVHYDEEKRTNSVRHKKQQRVKSHCTQVIGWLHLLLKLLSFKLSVKTN